MTSFSVDRQYMVAADVTIASRLYRTQLFILYEGTIEMLPTGSWWTKEIL